MKLLWKYIRNYKKVLLATLVLAAINQIFSLLDPQIFRYLIDHYATQIHSIGASGFFKGVALLLALSVLVALISRIAKNFQDYYVNVIIQRVGAGMYAESVEHSFSLPYAVFEDQRSGEFLQKLQQARIDSQNFIQGAINTVFLALVGILFVIAYAFYVNWLIGVVYFSIIPVLGTATFIISRKIKSAQKEIIAQTAALAGSTTETLRNVELVKSLGLEKQEISRLNNVNEDILRLELKKVKLIRKFSFIQGTLINALRSALMFVMLFLIFRGSISLGEFFSLLFYSFAIFNPLGVLGDVATSYQETKASMERLGAILQTPAQALPENPIVLGEITNVRFEGVGFKYPTASKDALQDIDFEVEKGKTIAFVGPSGSGKTTIVKLLVGLYQPVSGEIFFSGEDANKLDLEKLRNRIGLVSQDTQLFAGTIRENLLFARPNATDQECLDVLKSAAALSILSRGDDAGLNTRIGEGGLKLSGGEKQRLAIARALLRNPDMIIFDEATSSLDSLTEQEITQTIKNIRQARPDLISVLIAHRLSTVAHADNIFVLEKGKIAEFGNHNKLLQAHGLYAALWRQQIASDDDLSYKALDVIPAV